LPSAIVEPFEVPPPPPPDDPPELAAVRAPVLLALALAPPEPALPVGPLASALDEHWVVVVVVGEATDPPAALVVDVVDFDAAPVGFVVVVVVADEHPAPPAPSASVPIVPAPLEPVTAPEPCTIGLWAAASMADCASRLPHPAKRRATLASARAATQDRCRSGRRLRVMARVPPVRPAPRCIVLNCPPTKARPGRELFFSQLENILLRPTFRVGPTTEMNWAFAVAKERVRSAVAAPSMALSSTAC
jgi:hypothetical protein